MGSLEELEERVARLEAQMRQAREDSAAARVLAGGADRDVQALSGKIDMLKALIDALRETQIEHGERLGSLDGKVGSIEGRLGSLEQRVQTGFAMLATGQAEILALLSRPDES